MEYTTLHEWKHFDFQDLHALKVIMSRNKVQKSIFRPSNINTIEIQACFEHKLSNNSYESDT